MFVRAIGKFFERLNPLVQAQELGGLAVDIGSGLYNGLKHTIVHPIVTAEKVSAVTLQGIKFLVNTACFVSDITDGECYLSPQEYQQRVDMFWNGINVIPADQLKQLTAENWVDLGAHIAADFVFGKGFSSAFIYLKEIDAMSKMQQQAAKVARTFKKVVDTHLADNPILVTSEGVVIKMSKNMKDVGGAAREIISDSQMFIESFTKGHLGKISKHMGVLRQRFDNKVKGFAECAGQWIKIPYEHIFTIDLKWNIKKGKLSKINGFHHDFYGYIEKNGPFEFVNKVMHKSGCYAADIVYEGSRIPDKTFFPKEWSREKVVSKIYEAVENFKKSGVVPKLNDKGKYKISGFTSEGIEIEMYITQNGHITTAYPVL